jgi:glycosyltransferase 2 family protein
LKLLKSKKFWGLLLAVALLVYCFRDFNFHDVIKAISQVDYWYLIPLIFLEAVIAYIRTARLKYIIDPFKKIRTSELYPIYCIGMMTNLIMPYLTGQVARIYLLSKKGKLKKTFLVTTTVLEVLFDGLALIGIGLFISLFFVLPDEFHVWDFFAMAGLIILTALFLFWISHLRQTSGGLLDRIINKLPIKVRKRADDIKISVFSGLETLKSSRHFTMVTLLSVLSWVTQAGLVYLLILAFGFKISLWGAVVITTMVTVMMIVVMAPVNIGTFQLATLAALAPFGINKSSALAFSFLLHIAVYIPPIILGAFFSFKEGLTLKQLRDQGEKSNGTTDSGDDAGPAGKALEASE